MKLDVNCEITCELDINFRESVQLYFTVRFTWKLSAVCKLTSVKKMEPKFKPE